MIPIYLIIPEQGTEVEYSIKPQDIILIVDNLTFTDVHFRYGEKVSRVSTPLTGSDIREAIQQQAEAEEKAFNDMFNLGDE
ncbi:MAG: hypothetical protein Unbinned96contig1001_13 [Prokaryotic dsDNA virus sp.]|nr:MAG: hypothetical protein Unbinned96contig1001_13 [Prokaryotic dsDNA virus sp.]|tara:strand:+ start:7927 stop:8169 length:243 start_codon:yes stop_codon:yes gene_type:complete